MPTQIRPSTSFADFAYLLETAEVWEDEDGIAWFTDLDTSEEEHLCDWVVIRDPERGYVGHHTWPDLLANRWFVETGSALAA